MTRTLWLVSVSAALAAVVALACPGRAAAERGGSVAVAGAYATSFDLVSDNCKGAGMKLDRARVALREPRRGRVEVDLPATPVMRGVVSRGGKFTAEAKRSKVGDAGLEGRFTAAGRVERGAVQFLFIAEYFQKDRPLCTQSWNAAGPRG